MPRAFGGRSLIETIVPRDRSNPAARICYLHIGMHKTGSTSIQRFLSLNRRQFGRAGVLFPTAGSDESSHYVAHHNVAYGLMRSPNFDPRGGGIAEVADELRAGNADSACLSSENLSLLWNDRAGLTQLRDAILQSGFTPRPVVYLRPQASACIAVYAQIVCNGGYRQPFSNYLHEVLETGRYMSGPSIAPPFTYDRFLALFATVFGAESLIVRQYRSGAPDGALLLDFARLLVNADIQTGAFELPTYRENGSLDFQTVLKFLGAEPDTLQRVKFAPLTVPELFRFGRRFRTSNQAVRRRYSVALPSFELVDLALATPFRRTLARTQSLSKARRALAGR